MSVAAPTTVFVITHEFHPRRGGIATFTEEIARAGAALGHSVEVWAQQTAPGATDLPDNSWPFTLRRLPLLKGTHNFTCRLALARHLIHERRRLRHATVYLSEPGPMLAMMMLMPWSTFRPRRLVLTFHGSEILRFHADPVTRWLTRRLIRHAFRISTLTRYTRKLLCDRFPEAASKTFLTPGALRADFATKFTPATARTADRIIVLTVGRLHPRKGQLFTLEALQALPPALRDRVEYWIVGATGKPHYETTLRAAAARPGLAVRFLGDVPSDRLDGIYAQADIFALTSIDHGHSVEGFGLVYLEASAHGLPVVAHHVGGVPEAVLDGETGFLVLPRHPASLTEAFRKLIEAPDLRRQFGAAGRAWARRTTWTHAAGLLFAPGDELPENELP
ncbi:MAG: glycosyltransferase family 4 protein [Opitutaceae bacterium]|jgi:glycosyltransferase involved in cell wall biosynthesis